jgi:hypothetical protein
MPLRVDVEAVSLWEPMPRAGDGARDDESPAGAGGVAIQSWGFRPPRSGEGDGNYEIEVNEPESEQRLEEQRMVVVKPARSWTFEGRYVETREFRGPDGEPRPKHFFDAKVPRDLVERLRQSPEELLGMSDLNEVRPMGEDE